MDVVVKEGPSLDAGQVLSLYQDAGWSFYTKHMDDLMSAIGNSSLVLSAWLDQELAGLVRILTDGHFIIYVQDILIKEKHRRLGIGTLLLTKALERVGEVRQIVLLTDDTPMTRGFYEKLGFSSCDRGDLVSFVRMKR